MPTPHAPIDSVAGDDRTNRERMLAGDNVWLGGGVIVCPGVTIGDKSVIGAGSMVTREIPPDVVAVGSPARVIRSVRERT